MDPAALLQPRSEEAPSGDNMEYDPVFIEMEAAAQPGREVQLGDEITPAKGVEYVKVAEKAMAVLQGSHDLRAAVFLADALLHAEGLTGFAAVAAYIRGCVEQYWDSCHPELDPDDDDDPTMRINAVQGLCGQPGEAGGPSPVYTSLRRVALSESRGFGSFSLRDIEIADGHIRAPEEMETPPDIGAVTSSFQDTPEAVIAARRGAAQSALADIRAVSAVFDERTPGIGPKLDPLIKLLDQIVKAYGRFAASAETETEAEPPLSNGADPAEPAAAGAVAPAGGGAIRTPSDVTAALDRIIDYYRRHEPSSPSPLLLKRARRLVNADFMTIVQDLAPGGVDNVNLISGNDDE